MGNLMQLNNALFAELARLESVDTTDNEAMKTEIDRAHAINGIAGSIINNAKVIVSLSEAGVSSSKNVTVPNGLLNG